MLASSFLPRGGFLSLLGAVLVGLAQPGAALQDCSFPTVPTPRTLHQPDGRAIELYFRGSALNHWYEDLDGFPVVQTADGWTYARRDAAGELAATGALVGASDPRQLALERHVVPARRAPARGAPSARVQANPTAHPAFLGGGGSVQNLVVLLRFSDHGPSGQNRTLPSAANVSTIMNAVGGDPVLAPTGSVRDHYLEGSRGQFTIDSTVVGWIDVPESEVYYANGFFGLTEVTWELIIAGLEAADALVDFSDFDQDGNGWIDAITFLHSGYGAEWGDTDQYGTEYWDRMWSHKWTIPTWTSDEGVRVGDYNISPGLWSTFGSDPGRIGVVCHELAHFFGLPDLYDTDGSSEGAGNWCLMAGGSWGFDGSQQYPSHLSAWSKLKLGWTTPTRLLPGAHSAAEIELNDALFVLDSGYPPGEYLLIENRQPTGFDAVIPQGGLAIWHIDENKGSFTWNDPNNDEGYPGQPGWPSNGSHYRVGLLQADGFFDLDQGFGRGDGGDVYRSGFASVLDTNTTPDSDAYQGGTIVVNSNRLQGIGAASANMAFTYVNAAAPVVTSTTLPPAVVGKPYSTALTRTGGSAPFRWSEFIDAPSYTLTDLGPTVFALGGTAQNFKDDENTWAVNLPFAFPYYETRFGKVYVTPNGCVDLAPLVFESNNGPTYLRLLPRIAGLWDDLATVEAGDDIFVDTSESGRVRIRWLARTVAGAPVNVAISLYRDGRIRFEYGPGNAGLTPTVGISRSHGGDVLLASTHDGQPTLTGANALEFALQGSQLPPGLSLASGGLLSGTPAATGTYTFRVRVRDAANRYDQRLVTLNVVDRSRIQRTSKP